MNVIAYLATLAVVISAAAAWDSLWLRYLRPLVAESYGWPAVAPDERIKPVVWVGAYIVLAIAGLIDHIGTAVFY